MPLNKRQKEQAADFLFKDLQAQGYDAPAIESMIADLKPSEFESLLEKGFLDANASKVAPGVAGVAKAVIGGAGEGLTAGITKMAVPALQGALAEAQGEDYEVRKNAVEDEMALAQLSQPVAYNLAKFGSYFVPAGLTARLAAGGLKLAAGAGLKGAAALATAGVTSQVPQTVLERTADDNLTAANLAGEVALSAAVPVALSKAIPAAQQPVKAARSAFLDVWAKAAKSYKTGRLTDLEKEILNNLPEVSKIASEGVELTKDKLGQERDRILGVIADRLGEAKRAVGEVDEAATAKEFSKYANRAVDEYAQAISEAVDVQGKVVREDLLKGLGALKTFAKEAPREISKQYKIAISEVEELGKDLSLNIKPFVSQLVGDLKASGIDTRELPRPAREALELIAKKASKPLSFKDANDLKIAIGQATDFSSQSPIDEALKKFYGVQDDAGNWGGLRGLLTESAKSLPTTVDVDRLFGEWWSGQKLARKFANVFDDKNSVDAFGVNTLNKLAERAGIADDVLTKPFTQLKPVSEPAAIAMKETITNLARRESLQKIQKIDSIKTTLRKIGKLDAPELGVKQIDELVGVLKERDAFLRSIDNMGLPKQLVKSMKVGGETYKASREAFVKAYPGTEKALDLMHDKIQKSLRLNNYQPVQVFEELKNVQALPTNKLDDLQDMFSLLPDLQKLTKTERLAELAGAKEVRPLKMAPTMKSALSWGIPGVSFAVATNPWLVTAAMAAERLHYALSNPVRAAVLAEKYKLVPTKEAAEWGRRASELMLKVLPAVRGTAVDMALPERPEND